MTIHARVPAAAVDGASALYRDFLAPGDTPVRRWLPAFAAGAPAWRAAASRAAAVDAALVTVLRDYNAALRVDPSVIARLDGLADGSVRAVVTGQQPGVMGGPLLSLYKAAAAVALARGIEIATGCACVPVFWLGADDDDFAEVRELSVLATDGSRLDVSLDASGYRPGLRVGDMNAAGLRAAWSAVTPVLPRGAALDHLTACAAAAGDFADAAARVLVAATGGRILVVDGRAPALRTSARSLLLDFFDREPQLRDALEKNERALEAAGYHAQVQWGPDSGLFVVEDGVRHRVPPERRESVRAQLARDITVASPGVIARNLMQDVVLAPIAVVLGPAEIAYRAQMTGVHAALGVDMPMVVPRLSATYLPPNVRDMLMELGLDAAALALDPDAVAAAASARGASDGLRSAGAALEAAFARETAAFLARASARLDERAQQKLKKRLDEVAGRLAQTVSGAIEHDRDGARARWPFLPRLTDMFRKDTVAQERFLSLMTPMLFHGADAWRSIDALADEWARDALDGRVWHGVYSI